MKTVKKQLQIKHLLAVFLSLAACYSSLAQNTFPPSGNVGIGTINPQAGLSIDKNRMVLGGSAITGNYGSEATVLEILAPGPSYLALRGDNNNSSLFISAKSSHGGSGIHYSDSPFKIGTYDGEVINAFYAALDGKVGIGTTSPTEKFDVDGTVRLRGIIQDNTQTRVMVTDTNGKIFWRNASTIAGSDNQTLSLTGTVLGISGGNTIDLNSINSGGSNLIHNTGAQNIFVGEGSGANISIGAGYSNAANGYQSLHSNLSGHNNTASGGLSLFSNTTGFSNTAAGYSALFENTTGKNNTATGTLALDKNTQGNDNTANGWLSLGLNTTGDRNTAIGGASLYYNILGNYNTAIGFTAGSSVGNNNLSNSTAVGYNAVTTASNQVRIGNALVTDIGGQVSWSTLSDGRFKKTLKEDVVGLNFINALKPVSYQVDKDKLNTHLGIPDSVQAEMRSLNAKSTNGRVSEVREIGFVAQDVVAAMEKTGFEFNGVHTPVNEHDHYTIRYAEFVVPLVKAVQELNALVHAQQVQINTLLKGTSNTKPNSDISLGLNSNIQLFQNHPNPFTLDTQIEMELPDAIQKAQVMIYNQQGKEIKSLEVTSRGKTTLQLNGGELEAGMYFYVLIADGKVVDTKRMILTKK